MKIKYLIIIMLMILLTVSFVSANENTTEIQTADNNTEMLETTHTVNGKTFTDIQKSIDNAKNDDTINLKGDYTSSGKTITVTKSITIDGKGATLNANKKSSVFNVKSKSLTLKNMKIINSKGTAITSKNCILTLINCSLKNNGGQILYHKTEYAYYVDADVGALSAKNGKLNIIDSTFTDNLGDMAYAVSANNAETIIENSVFTKHNDHNKNFFSWGCIIYLHDSPSKIINTKLIDNMFTGIYTNAPSTIEKCQFKNNDQVISYTGNTPSEKKSKIQMNIINSIFTNNIQPIDAVCDMVLNIDKCEFSENTDSAIIYAGQTINIKNSHFNKNSATKGAALNGHGILNIINTTFNQNSAKYGGTIFSESLWDIKDKYLNSITIINSTITNSKATKNGGAVYGEVLDLTLINTKVTTQSSSKGSQVYLNVGNYKNVNSTKISIKKIEKIEASVEPISRLTTTYDSGKKICVEVRYNNGKSELGNTKLKFKVYTGKKYKIYYFNPNYKSDPGFKIDSSISVGKHKVVVISNGKYFKLKKNKFTITIKKAKTTVIAKKIVAKYKKSKYFKATIKNKASYKPVSKIKVKVKVYTGKKAKTFILKTNKKGVVKFNTEKLKRGIHKVKITSKNSKYEISKISSIKIK